MAKCSDPYLEFVLCISLIQLHTDSSEHTHGAVGSHIAAAPGEQQYLLSLVIEGWRERWLFIPPTYNPCRTWDSNPQPLGYKSDSLTIRPQLSH